jgi:hypothetical protein
MALPIDVYTTVIGANFLSQSYATLAGFDLFFYVSSTNDLCLKQQGNPIVQTVLSGASLVSTVSVSGLVHVYYADINGAVYYFPFTTSNFTTPVVPVSTGISSARSLSNMYTTASSPHVYAMIIDNGSYHVIYTATSPDFLGITNQVQTYDNIIDPGFYVGHPVFALHHDDTDRATIHCQKTNLSTGDSQTGFYVAKLPGVA